MAGGTGGHVFPALAVAEVLRSRAWNVVWLGAPNGMEVGLVAEHGFPMELVEFSGVRGKGWRTKLATPLRLFSACRQSARAIRKVQPDVVLGMGGYISFPGGVMASLFNKKLVIHEQNSIAGMANRALARLASKVLVAFPNALPRSTHTGNPVRLSITQLDAPRERYAKRGGRLQVLVVGGSLGAQALNEALPKALALIPWSVRPEVVHQSGRQHIDALRDAYAKAEVEAKCVSFINDMAEAYSNADLVICRAGATTIAELAAAGVAAVLVPFPRAVDDHQTVNARYLADRGAAILLPQRDMTPENLARMLIDAKRSMLGEMAEKARSLAMPHATEAVADECEAVAR